VAGLRLKGFVFDGQDRIPELLVVTGRCPGLVLEDVTFERFTRGAVACWNCVGEGNPVVLRRLRAVTTRPVDWALNFNARPTVIPALNQDVTVLDSRFEGPFRAAVQFAGPVARVVFRRNRFFRSAQAFLYAKGVPRRYQTQTTLDANTFAEVAQVALHFEGLPLVEDRSAVVVRNNLFFHTAVLAQTDEPKRLPEVKSVFRLEGNARDPASKEGNLPLEAAAIPFDLPTDPGDDARFVRYPPGLPLGQAGAGQQPVGVPQAQ
jgi:hypothetical protein